MKSVTNDENVSPFSFKIWNIVSMRPKFNHVAPFFYAFLVLSIVVLMAVVVACDDQENFYYDGLEIKNHEDVWDIHPDLKDKINAVGNIYYKGESILSSKVIELGALITARYWSAEIDWVEHVEFAIQAGISEEIIESIRIWEQPYFEDDTLETAYQYAVEMLTYKNVTDVTYENAVEEFSKKGVVELAGLLGHHTIIGLTLKAFRLKPETSPNLLPGNWDIELDNSEVDNPRKKRYGFPFFLKAWPRSYKLFRAEAILASAFPFMTDNFNELSIIITARAWDSITPWSSHVSSALLTGVASKAVKAIGLKEDATPYLSEEENSVYRMAMELFDNTLDVSEDTYNDAVELVGVPKLVKLVASMGFYSQVSLSVNNANYILFPIPSYSFPID